jgi:hypothetical protein
MAMASHSNRIVELEETLEAYKAEFAELDLGGNHQDVFIGILKNACSLIRDADSSASDFQAMVERVDRLINNAVGDAYGPSELYTFIPSFAHSDANPELDGKIFDEGMHCALIMFPVSS